MKFETIKNDVLYEDGSLRDVLIRNTTRDSYEELCNLLLRQGIRHEILMDGKTINIFEAIAEFDKGTDRLFPFIRFYIGEICLVCHFFEEGEIEIDFRPNDIKTVSDWESILDVLHILSSHFQQAIAIYAENVHDRKLYEIKTQSGKGE